LSIAISIILPLVMGWGVFFGENMFLAKEYVVFYRLRNGPVERVKIYTCAWERDLTAIEVANRIANKKQVSSNQIQLLNLFKKVDLLDGLKAWGSR
jgi:hypothetical protein